MDENEDPGVGGPKLSKSDAGEVLAARNKSYEKVLDAQIAWMRTKDEGKFDNIPNTLYRWKQKSAYHEKEFGW